MATNPWHLVRSRPLATLLTIVMALTATGFTAGPAYADANRDKQWHLAFLDVPAAHQQAQGEGVTVAVVDTGVDANHPDLRGNVLPGIDAYNTQQPGTTDTVGHGTGMASIIAGHGHGAGNTDGLLGIAPKAKILPVKVATAAGRGTRIDPRAVGLGMLYAANRGADVILVSISGNSSPEMREAIAAAERKGAHVIAAAGNSADGPNVIGFPAALNGVAAVASVDRKGTFSPSSVSGDEMDLAAPGVDIAQAMPNGGYTVATGTSSAAAIVAGVTALLISRYPEASRAEIAARLLWTATDKGEPGKDARYGHGIVNLAKGLAGPAPTAAPGAQPTTGGDEPDATAVEVPESGFFIDWASFVPFWPCLIPLVLAIVAAVVLVLRARRKVAAAAPPPAVAPEPPPSTPDMWRRPPDAGQPPG